MENEIISKTLIAEHGNNYIRLIQVVWVSSFCFFFIMNMALIRTILMDSKPLFPYSSENINIMTELEKEIVDALVEVQLEEEKMKGRLRTRSTEDLDELEGTVEELANSDL